jgi:phosphate starvation-inducible PhoH-like protein
MGKKAYGKKKKHLRLVEEQALKHEVQARQAGPSKKRWSEHDMKSVRPITKTQEEMHQCYYQGSHICGFGSAGTGKTYVATSLAIRDVIRKDTVHDKLIFVRSNVATRDVGFLPGSLDEKMEVFETPYRDILGDLFGRATTYDDMKAAGIVHFMPTSFIRGLTWDDAIVIVDEAQNLTMHEINSIMTRLGENSRVILVGDCVQTDLRKNKSEVTGFDTAIKIFDAMKSFSVISFTQDDIVRGGTVKEWITTYDRFTQ